MIAVAEDDSYARGGPFVFEPGTTAEGKADPVSRAMASRSNDLSADPPRDWQGVYRFDKK